MKKYLLIKSIVLLLITVIYSSCDAVLDQDKTDFGKGPILTQFQKATIVANFVKDGTVQTYDIPLTIIGGRNEPINEPITITISVDPSSTASLGSEFTLETTTYTIPAGKMAVNAQIKVSTNKLDPFDAKSLILKIDSSNKGISEKNKTKIVLQAVCPLNLDNFVGNYTSTKDGISSNSVVVLGSAPNSLLITTGSEKILIQLNPEVTKPTITYVDKGAVLSVHTTYGDVWATTINPELSTYNSCDYSLNLEFKRCVSVGCFAGSIVKKLVKKP